MPNDIYDLSAIKSQAKKNIVKGAVTEDYPLDLKQAHSLLNEALATEIMCVLRYRAHAIAAHGEDYSQVKAEFIEHAKEEEEHMLMIAERINQLNGEPDFSPANVIKNAATEYGNAKSLEEMIEANLVAERIVIPIYRKLIAWFGDKDPTTRIMLEHILEQEEDHANDLADFLHSNSEK